MSQANSGNLHNFDRVCMNASLNELRLNVSVIQSTYASLFERIAQQRREGGLPKPPSSCRLAGCLHLLPRSLARSIGGYNYAIRPHSWHPTFSLSGAGRILSRARALYENISQLCERAATYMPPSYRLAVKPDSNIHMSAWPHSYVVVYIQNVSAPDLWR